MKNIFFRFFDMMICVCDLKLLLYTTAFLSWCFIFEAYTQPQSLDAFASTTVL